MKRPERFSLPLTLATCTRPRPSVLEQQLDRRLDLGLGRVVGARGRRTGWFFSPTNVLFSETIGASRYLHQTFRFRRAHFSISSNLATARVVSSTLSELTSDTGSAWRTSSTRTLGRLRAER